MILHFKKTENGNIDFMSLFQLSPNLQGKFSQINSVKNFFKNLKMHVFGVHMLYHVLKMYV